MTAVAASIVQWADDRLNPIVVKELRQAVQSRFVVVVLVLFLIVELASLAIFLLASDDITANFNAGRDAFMILQATLLGTCLLFVPLYAGIRFAGERSETNVDLLFVTTIRPAAIVRGKMVAGFMVALLIYSACAPFMVITHLLRGIDLPSIFLILGLDLLVVFTAMQAAIFLAAVPMTTFLKAVAGVGLLVGLLITYSITMSASMGMLYFGSSLTLGTWESWGVLAAVVSPFALIGGLLFVLTMAVLTPSSANRMLVVRLYLLGAWLLGGAVAVLLTWGWGSSTPVEVWFVFSVLVLSVMLVLSTGEREAWGPRMRRHIPRRRWLRAPAFLVYTGSAGGVLFYGLMLALTGGVFGASYELLWSAPRQSRIEEMGDAVLTSACFAIAYALTAVFLRRVVLRNWLKPMLTPGLTIALVAAACLVPMLTAFMLDPVGWDRDSEIWMLLNPFVSMSMSQNTTFMNRQMALAASWAGVAALLCLPWFIGQWRRFRPLEAQAVRPLEDAPTPPALTPEAVLAEGAGDA